VQIRLAERKFLEGVISAEERDDIVCMSKAFLDEQTGLEGQLLLSMMPS
jgi:hypothetical protein